MTQRAVFLAREGVLCEDAALVSRPQDIHWLPGAVQALKWLQRAGWRLVIVTNQPGIARGLFGPAEYDNLTSWMRSELAGHGVSIDGVYHCPHLPDTPLAAWRRQCECHLPQPALLRRAARDLGLALASCVMMGHSNEDIAAGRAAGVAACVRITDDEAVNPDGGANGGANGVTLETGGTAGANADSMAGANGGPGGALAQPALAPPPEAVAPTMPTAPDFTCASLAEAAYWLLAHETERRA